MRELTINELEVVAGAAEADWGKIGGGLGAVALSVAVAATPIGVIGTAAAAGLSFFGGVAIGDGLINGQAFSIDGD